MTAKEEPKLFGKSKTIDDILAIDDTQRKTIPIPEWETDITVFSMSADERAAVEQKWSNKKASTDPRQFRIDVLSKCLKKADGSPLVSEEQMKKLMTKNANAVERVFEAACSISAFSNADVKELEKN